MKYDSTITLGNMLSIASFLFAGFAAYNNVDKRVTVLEEQMRNAVKKTEEADRRFSDALKEIKTELSEIRKDIREQAIGQTGQRR